VKLLLDTHVWIWGLLEPERLSPGVRQALVDADNELYLSPISVWETLVLVEKGRLELRIPVEKWIEQALAEGPIFEAPLSIEIARVSRRLALAHQDPADRFIAATAFVGGLTLVTADERLLACSDVSVLPAT
jgi:PIN domain nuclease of toxin-antitoxin system